MIKVKTFIHALNSYHVDLEVMKRYLKDHRLTQGEKTIIKCWLMLRDSQFKEVVEILQNLKHLDDVVVESQKELLLGIALNNKCEAQKAVPHLQKSLKLISGLGLRRQEFVAYNNLFITYRNLKDQKGMKASLDEFLKISCELESEVIGQLICRFNYLCFIGNHADAMVMMEEIEEMRPLMTERQNIAFLVDRFDLAMKVEDFTEAGSLLEMMKKYRKFNYSANFKFMRGLLDHLVSSKPVYLYDQQFADYPLLFNQMKVIKSLEEQDLDRAHEAWKWLSQFSSTVYANDFTYKGDQCLFSLCLQKHLNENSTDESDVTQLPEQKEDAVLLILQKSNSPVKKEQLYAKIWGELPVDKDDFQKLEKIISRLRKKHGIEIKTQKGCYLLVSQQKKAS